VSGLPTVAGVALEDEEELMGLLHTIYSPNIPIQDVATGRTFVPADDLPGAVAEQLGLDPAALTDEQRASIDRFIQWAEEETS
jgi:predicted ATP-dependent Lon-type protease